MAKLLFVCHCPSDNTRRLRDAALTGIDQLAPDNIKFRSLSPLEASAAASVLKQLFKRDQLRPSEQLCFFNRVPLRLGQLCNLRAHLGKLVLQPLEIRRTGDLFFLGGADREQCIGWRAPSPMFT